MIKSISKKALSLILLLCILLSSSLALISCANNEPPEEPSDDPIAPPSTEKESYLDKLIQPTYTDYGRGTINFSEIVYTRPDFSAINALCTSLTEKIKANGDSYENFLAELTVLDDKASNLLTMYSFARIQTAKDSSEAFWIAEYEYISKNYSGFAKNIEDMKVACANSPYAENFEQDFFSDGFVEKYKDGSSLSEAEALLLAEESALIAEYNSISTANVEITYLGKTDTVDNILSFHKEKYGAGSSEYLAAENSCMTLYYEKFNSKSKLIYVELIKLRSKIAEESGYDSYLDYCYTEKKLDYTPEDTSELLSDIVQYVLPVYFRLYEYVFYQYEATEQAESSSFDTTINTSYEVIGNLSSDLQSIFAYMLQHRLFDIENDENPNRDSGAYTTYLYDYNAPFIFITGEENVRDYSTLFHEFGHFADFYINGGNSASTDVSEISSQALELLVLEELSKTLGEKQETYLLCKSFQEALETLFFQGYYARFEEMVYKLDYNQITAENLDALVITCANEFYLNTQYFNSVEDIIIPHFIIEPVYVHSYCTSIIPSLEIYFLEEENKGDGFDAYMSIISHGNTDEDFLTLLNNANLTSPFEENCLRMIADKIHYRLLGAHYYTENPPSQVA